MLIGMVIGLANIKLPSWTVSLITVSRGLYVAYCYVAYWCGCLLHFAEKSIYRYKETNIHKPCLAQHVAFLIKNDNGDAEWIRSYFPKLKQFTDCYINNYRHKNGLYYWYNDTVIGVDNDPFTFFHPNKSSASIYLNCLPKRP